MNQTDLDEFPGFCVVDPDIVLEFAPLAHRKVTAVVAEVNACTDTHQSTREPMDREESDATRTSAGELGKFDVRDVLADERPDGQPQLRTQSEQQ